MKIKDYINNKINYHAQMYPEDVNRIINVCRNQSIDITVEEAIEIWETYSDDFSARWMSLPSYDNDLFDIIIEYAEKLWKENI
jgi:hypothetical protein